MASVKTVTQVGESRPPPKESSPRRAASVSLFAWGAWQHPGAPPQLEPVAGGAQAGAGGGLQGFKSSPSTEASGISAPLRKSY